ncbi:MAG: UDP-GlcNAc3NAcA epimerase, partial [Solirubrobacteraceae bacterium]|nr:UDP-GlcNAc3NAcA epimerase [Solirubrobacteraceae bacterium]
MKIVTVIGNRPQFVKAAAVSRPLRSEHEEVLVHTGQHYDDELSTIFVTELDVPRPEVQLELGGGTNTEQTARMLTALGALLRDEAPDAVLVYGDTNSTLAGALAAAQLRIPVAHVEAGMRSFDRAMPEELNRVLTDHLAELLLAPSDSAAANLAREGVAGEVEVVGDVMVDVAALLAPRARADDGPLHAAGVSAARYVLVT